MIETATLPWAVQCAMLSVKKGVPLDRAARYTDLTPDEFFQVCQKAGIWKRKPKPKPKPETNCMSYQRPAMTCQWSPTSRPPVGSCIAWDVVTTSSGHSQAVQCGASCKGQRCERHAAKVMVNPLNVGGNRKDRLV